MGDIKVTYADMQHAAGQLTSYEDSAQDTLRQAQAMITNLVNGGFVTQQASKAFDQSYTEFTQGASKMLDGMKGMVQYLNQAAQTLEHTDSSLANAIRGK